MSPVKNRQLQDANTRGFFPRSNKDILTFAGLLLTLIQTYMAHHSARLAPSVQKTAEYYRNLNPKNTCAKRAPGLGWTQTLRHLVGKPLFSQKAERAVCVKLDPKKAGFPLGSPCRQPQKHTTGRAGGVHFAARSSA